MRKIIRLPIRTDPVVVIGMHRSGTTLLTRILSRLGIFMGHKLQATDEPIFFRDLDNRLLSIAHAAWDMPLNVSYLLENENYKKRIINYMISEVASIRFLYSYVGIKNAWRYFGPQKIRWGIKEPRMTILWSLWKEVYSNAAFIFIHRNGTDVAASLYQREKKQLNLLQPGHWSSLRCRDLSRAFALWEEYHAIFLHDAVGTGGCPLHILGYENLLEDPAEEMNKIGEFLGIRFDPELARKATSGIDASRRYAFRKDEELLIFHEKMKNSEFMRRFGYDRVNAEFCEDC
jgi:hypothetical protein